jgi:hypothetical protein
MYDPQICLEGLRKSTKTRNRHHPDISLETLPVDQPARLRAAMPPEEGNICCGCVTHCAASDKDQQSPCQPNRFLSQFVLSPKASQPASYVSTGLHSIDIFLRLTRLQELLGSWTLSIVRKHTQVSGETSTVLGPLERANLDHWTAPVRFTTTI